MKLTKYFTIFSLAVFSQIAVSCEESFDEPEHIQYQEMTGVDFTTIKDLKALCGSGNDNVSVVVTEDLVIKGKVTTTDRYGNFYRSFYIQDETTGIEIKQGKSQLYNTYHEGQTVYVKAKGLCLGRSNGMISLGAQPAEGSTYVNTWIDSYKDIDKTIILGPLGDKVTPKEVTASSQLNDNDLGTLVTIKAAKNTGKIGYSFYYNAAGESVTVKELLTWAIPNVSDDEDLNAGYGSHYFSLGTQQYLIRTSGYCKFASELVTDRCEVNKTADVTAIYTKYQKGTYSPEYQLLLNNSSDVVAND